MSALEEENAWFESEDATVFRHRLHEFEKLGFNEHHALQLAEAGADHHRAQRMLDQGCQPAELLRILL